MGSLTVIPKGSLDDVNASSELAQSAPSFGNVLRSIGCSIADSQSKLDQSVVETVQHMSDTKIDVITDVILELGDDGQPLPAEKQPEPLKQKLSLLNFFAPTVHEWKHVALSMDLTVSSFHYQHGMIFNQVMKQKDQVTYPLNWGFLGWFKTDLTSDVTTTTRAQTQSDFHQDVDWAEGQVRIDALLGPRRTTKFPVPSEVSLGPQIFFNQGAIAEKTDKNTQLTTERSTTFTVTVLKADGSNNAGAPLEADAGGLLVSFTDDKAGGGKYRGNIVNDDGQVKLTLTRDLRDLASKAPVDGKLTILLGQMSKNVKVRL